MTYDVIATWLNQPVPMWFFALLVFGVWRLGVAHDKLVDKTTDATVHHDFVGD